MTIKSKNNYSKEEVKEMFAKALLMKSGGSNSSAEPEIKEPTLEELREKLEKKRLLEELAKKGTKQTREHDESIIGVCKTCHFPIYYGEVIYTPHEMLTENEYGAEAGGAYGNGVFGGAVRGRSKGRRSSEGWIQCGFCYQIYERELEKVKKWDKAKNYFLWFSTAPTGLASLLLFWLIGVEGFKQSFMIIFLGGCVAGYMIGYLLHLAIFGQRPLINRYELRIKERKKYELGRKEVKVQEKQYEGEVYF